MQTYTEVRNQRSINWNKTLRIAKILKPLSLDMFFHSYIRSRSKSWITCACGNMCEIIPRTPNGEPMDPILNSLGVLFHVYVTNRNYNSAIQTLTGIEERSGTLVKEQLKKQMIIQ